MSKKTLTLFTVMILGVAGAAGAQTATRGGNAPEPARMVERMDSNGDRRVSMEEFAARAEEGKQARAERRAEGNGAARAEARGERHGKKSGDKTGEGRSDHRGEGRGKSRGEDRAARGKPGMEERFQRIDANSDGYLTVQELADAREARAGKGRRGN